MGSVQIVGLGLCTLDLLVRLKEMPTWERGTTVSSFSLDGGGMVGTALVAAARLGASTGYVGTAGNDRAAQLKVQSLLDEGVDVSRLVIIPGPESQVVLVCVDRDTGERIFSGSQRLRDDLLPVERLDQQYISSAQILHLDGMFPRAALQAAKWMHHAGRTVVYDGHKTNRPVAPAVEEIIKFVDVLICATGFGASLSGETDVWRIGRAILRMGPSIVVQTEGENGSYTVTASDCFHTPAFQVDVIDTTGAGDVFHGAYIVGLLRGWDLRTVALFSSAVAALKCTELGGRAGIPSFQQATAFLGARGLEIEP